MINWYFADVTQPTGDLVTSNSNYESMGTISRTCPIILIDLRARKCESELANSIIYVPSGSIKYAKMLQHWVSGRKAYAFGIRKELARGSRKSYNNSRLDVRH
jgi:hypothetical protein